MVRPILVELHKMIGLWCPSYTSFLATELGETSCQAMNIVPRKWSHAYEQHRSIIYFFICTPSHNFVFSCDVNIGADLRTIEMH